MLAQPLDLSPHFQAWLPKACTSPTAIPGVQSQDVAHLCSVSLQTRHEQPESQSFILSTWVWECQRLE